MESFCYLLFLTHFKPVFHLLKMGYQFCFLGFTNIFPSTESMWCTQHLEKNDIEKLKEYCPCDADRKRIMADFYGTQN